MAKTKSLAALRKAAYAAAQPPATPPAPTDAQREVLSFLAGNNGAMLWWQLPERLWDAAADAALSGVIRNDPMTDLYIHPRAIEDDGAYWMPPEVAQ